MKIASIEYSLNTYSLDIYLSGCKGPHCKGCHNPEAWSFEVGTPYEQLLAVIKLKVMVNRSFIERIMIFGGEPLDQPITSLLNLLGFLSGLGVEIWLFTRYDFNEISDDIKRLCDVIKCGRYVEEKRVENGDYYKGVRLATSNQHFYIKQENVVWVCTSDIAS